MTTIFVHYFIRGSENLKDRLVIRATARLYARYGHRIIFETRINKIIRKVWWTEEELMDWHLPADIHQVMHPHQGCEFWSTMKLQHHL